MKTVSQTGRPSEPEPVEPPADEPPIPDSEDLPGTPRPASQRGWMAGAQHLQWGCEFAADAW